MAIRQMTMERTKTKPGAHASFRAVHLHYRRSALTTRADSIDEENRTVQGVIASETPVLEFDFERGEMVPRVLLARGAQFDRKISLLDTHSRFSEANVLGSVFPVRETNVVAGTLQFSTQADSAWTKVREGHLESISAGFRILDEIHIAAGRKRTIAGRVFEGPVNVVRRWRLIEASVVPIGADELAKMRGLDPRQLLTEGNLPMSTIADPKTEKDTVSARFQAWLDESDAERSDQEIADWFAENAPEMLRASAKDDPAPGSEKDVKRKAGDPPVERIRSVEKIRGLELDETKLAELIGKTVDDRLDQRDERKAAFRKEVDAMCDIAGLPTDFDRAALYQQDTRDNVLEAIKAEQKRQSEQFNIGHGGHVRFSDRQPSDEHRDALRGAFLTRCADNVQVKPKTREKWLESRHKGWEDFKRLSIKEFAVQCLIADGFRAQDVQRMANFDVCMAAMGFLQRANIDVRGTRAEGAAYHITGSFPNITLDAVNKTLQAGYSEAPSTWRGPMREGAPVRDFKRISRIRLGEVENLRQWIDNKAPERAALSDSRETYAVEAKALLLSLSWQLMINDDLDAFSRVPSQMGQAAARSVNQLAWSQLIANPVMGDGETLFLETPTANRKRSNLTVGGAVPDSTALATMRQKMRRMRGENTPENDESDAILNLAPAWLVGPAALEKEIEQEVTSIADPSENQSGVANVNRQLTPLIEPLLDEDSESSFYLFASTDQIDTIEITFLEGQQSPFLNSFLDPETLSTNFTIIQTYGAKPLNHRGIQKHRQ